jgi:elongation factor G
MSRPTETALLSLAITPKTRADSERLRQALSTLTAEDPILRVKTDDATGEILIACMTENHLEIIIDRLKCEFNVEANVGPLRVAYRETVTRAAEGDARYVRQVGGRGQYAHAKIQLYPGEPGSGYVFENNIAGGSIPREFIRPVDDGVKEALARGVLAGYPVDDVRIVLYDGSYHEVDSSEEAFKIAGFLAFQDAARKAQPVVLEPVMRVEVVMPKQHTGDVIGSLSNRRARIQSREDRGDTHFINARVPLAEMLGYASELRSLTKGRATYSMLFDCYQPCALDDGDNPGPDSIVGAPRKPMPTLRRSSVALPEPDSDDRAS